MEMTGIKSTGITLLNVLEYLFKVPGRVLFGIRHYQGFKRYQFWQFWNSINC